MSKEINAYFAGLLDGEGYIGINNTSCRYVKNGVVVKQYLNLTVSILNSCKEPLELGRKIWGGNIHERKKQKNRVQTYDWKITSKKAEKFLRDVQSYSIIKKEQIKTALEFRKIMNYENRRGRKKALTQKMVGERLKLKQKLMNLNQHTGFGLKRELVFAQK